MFPYTMFPYTNTHELNLDWLLRQMVELTQLTEEFININSIKYADPLQWNITKQYEANTVVINPEDSTAYLSVKPVPTGVNITNTEYWTPIGNFAELYSDIKKSIAAPDAGSGTTTPVAVPAGGLIWWNNVLYRALSALPAGTALIIGANVLETNIYTELSILRSEEEDLSGRITEEAQARAAADNNLSERINEEAQARAASDNNLSGRITEEAAARATADESLSNRIAEVEEGTDKAEIIVLGNSYVQRGVADILCDTFYASHKYTSDGIGFVPYGSNNVTFEQKLDEAIADTSYDHNKVTAIVIVSAMGDSRAFVRTEDYVTNLSATLASIREKAYEAYPNLKRLCVVNAESRAQHTFGTLDKWHTLFYFSNCIFPPVLMRRGFEYLGWIGFNTLMNTDVLDSDNYHPTRTVGAFVLGTLLKEAYYGTFQYAIFKEVKEVSIEVTARSKVTALVTLFHDHTEIGFRDYTVKAGTTANFTIPFGEFTYMPFVQYAFSFLSPVKYGGVSKVWRYSALMNTNTNNFEVNVAVTGQTFELASDGTIQQGIPTITTS